MRLLDQMRLDGCQPTEQTFTGLIKALARKGRVEDVELLLTTMKEIGLEPNEWTYNAALQVYAKHGDPQGAESLIKRMRAVGISPSAMTFTTLMAAYAAGKQPEEVRFFQGVLLSMSRGCLPAPCLITMYVTFAHGLISGPGHS